MDDVNAILNGEIFILCEEMNSIANFERNAKREDNVERNAKREKNGLYKTFRMLSSTVIIIQLRPMALCMPRSSYRKNVRCRSCRELYNWIRWFSRFYVSREKHLRRTRIFPSGDLFRTCTLIYRGTVYTLKFFICSIYSWRAAKFNEGKKEGRRADWHD